MEREEGLVKYNEPNGRPYSKVSSLAYLPDRAKLRLDVQFKRAAKAGIDPLVTPLLWNPQTQLRFSTHGGLQLSTGQPRTTAPIVTPLHEYIVSTRKSALTGPEALALQGIRVPNHVLRQFTDRQLRDLAGNAMSTTVVAAVFLATMFTTRMVDDDPVRRGVATQKHARDGESQPKRRTRKRHHV